MVLAILLLILAGVALLILGRQFSAQFARTRAERTEAQLRQLLTAGAATASARAAEGTLPDREQVIAVPSELSSRGATLKLSRGGEGEAIVDAQVDGRRMSQVLRFTREGDRWTLRSATLTE